MLKVLCATIALVLCASCGSTPHGSPAAAKDGPVHSGPGDGATDDVIAYRYPMMVSMSALHFSHGASEWYDTLFIPEYQVVCRVFGDYAEPHSKARGTWLEDPPRLYAAFGTMAKERALNPTNGTESGTDPVEVRLPRSLAEKVRALAEIKRRHDLEALDVADSILGQGVVRPPRPAVSWNPTAN